MMPRFTCHAKARHREHQDTLWALTVLTKHCWLQIAHSNLLFVSHSQSPWSLSRKRRIQRHTKLCWPTTCSLSKPGLRTVSTVYSMRHNFSFIFCHYYSGRPSNWKMFLTCFHLSLAEATRVTCIQNMSTRTWSSFCKHAPHFQQMANYWCQVNYMCFDAKFPASAVFILAVC